MNENSNKTFHSVTGFPGAGVKKLNQYHDYQYGMEEGRFFTIWGTRWTQSNIHILPIHIPDGSDGEESSFNVGELGSIPG